MKSTTYPRTRTQVSLSDLVAIIRAEGENKTYMGATKRLGALLNPGTNDWYTPDADPFADAHPLGRPSFALGRRGVGWSVLWYVWDKGAERILETQRTVGIDSGPAKTLAERVLARVSR
ncbi:MAG TPA: hypothetical protein DEG43_04310 [Acidimicrobiaceae bacterium]|nr:hypothetical protein [Acidimicrobiaceae bacterium]